MPDQDNQKWSSQVVKQQWETAYLVWKINGTWEIPTECLSSLTNTEHTFFSVAHRTFSKNDCIIRHKTSLYKYKRNSENSLYPSRPQWNEVEVKWSDFRNDTQIWWFNYTLLMNTGPVNKSLRIFFKFLETNNNDTIYQVF